MGFVYIVKVVDWNRVKIGYWSSSLKRLRNRYITNYGSDLTLYIYETRNHQLLEKYFKYTFKTCVIKCELYKEDKLQAYQEFFNKLKDYSPEELEQHFEGISLSYSPHNRGRLVKPGDIDTFLITFNLMYIKNKKAYKDMKKESTHTLLTNSCEDLKHIREELITLFDGAGNMKNLKKKLIGHLDALYIIRRYFELMGIIDDLKEGGCSHIGPELWNKAMDIAFSEEEDQEVITNGLDYCVRASFISIDELKSPNTPDRQRYRRFVINTLMRKMIEYQQIRKRRRLSKCGTFTIHEEIKLGSNPTNGCNIQDDTHADAEEIHEEIHQQHQL